MKQVNILPYLLMLLLAAPLHAGPLLDKVKDVGSTAVDKTKEMGSAVVDIADETVDSAGKKIKGEKETPEVARSRIDAMENSALQRLFATSPGAGQAFDESPAYAVFDTRKVSLMLTTATGSGVAVNKETGKRVYMKMAEAGVNFGGGAQLYQVVFIFPTIDAYSNFVNKGLDAGASADAVAGKDDENIALRLPDGTRVYKLNEKGVVLSATLTGTKYWKWDELN